LTGYVGSETKGASPRRRLQPRVITSSLDEGQAPGVYVSYKAIQTQDNKAKNKKPNAIGSFPGYLEKRPNSQTDSITPAFLNRKIV